MRYGTLGLTLQQQSLEYLSEVYFNDEQCTERHNIRKNNPHTCCRVDGEEAFGVARNKTVRDSLLGILIIIGCIELYDSRASWTVFRHRWIVNRLRC